MPLKLRFDELAAIFCADYESDHIYR